MTKLYPSKLPQIRCKECGKYAKRTDWYPHRLDSRLRQFVCPFGHTIYLLVTVWFIEVEKYLGKEVYYNKKTNS